MRLGPRSRLIGLTISVSSEFTAFYLREFETRHCTITLDFISMYLRCNCWLLTEIQYRDRLLKVRREDSKEKIKQISNRKSNLI